MINKDYIYAIVWASKEKNKYWYKVLDNLIKSWYNTIPINPYEEEILWKKVYKTLSEFYKQTQKKIDVVIFVVPHQITEEVMIEVKKLKIKNVWMQPWSESKIAIDFCIENWIQCVHDACIMITWQS